MPYKRMDRIEADDFRMLHPNYHLYFNLHGSMTLERVDDYSRRITAANDFFYVINSGKKCIRVDEVFLKSNNYDIIFVSPESVGGLSHGIGIPWDNTTTLDAGDIINRGE